IAHVIVARCLSGVPQSRVIGPDWRGRSLREKRVGLLPPDGSVCAQEHVGIARQQSARVIGRDGPECIGAEGAGEPCPGAPVWTIKGLAVVRPGPESRVGESGGGAWARL